MPTYEYECTAGHRFERQQRITDLSLKRCVEQIPAGTDPVRIMRHGSRTEIHIGEDAVTYTRPCQRKVRRLISAPAFHLTGRRWAKDGYA